MTTVNRFTFFGIGFGFLFPFISMLLEAWFRFGIVSFSNIFSIHKNNPLLWVIDTAPLFLGLFARIAGKRQEAINNLNNQLQNSIKELRIEVARSNTIENNIRDLVEIYKKDLQSAKLIQEFSLPEIPKSSQFEILYKYIPLNPVGGDLISLRKIDSGLLSILVGDVVGHGISAALIASLVNVLANKNQEKNGLFPKRYLEILNTEANNYLPEDYYFTALYGLLSSNNNSTKFTFSRGGHPYPFVYSSSEKIAKIYEIAGTPLGLMHNLTYEELSIDLLPKDRIFIITDGFIEVKNKNGKLLGNKNFCNIITEACNQNLTLEDSISYILNKVDEFSIDMPADDDRFILAIEINSN